MKHSFICDGFSVTINSKNNETTIERNGNVPAEIAKEINKLNHKFVDFELATKIIRTKVTQSRHLMYII